MHTCSNSRLEDTSSVLHLVAVIHVISGILLSIMVGLLLGYGAGGPILSLVGNALMLVRDLRICHNHVCPAPRYSHWASPRKKVGMSGNLRFNNG